MISNEMKIGFIGQGWIGKNYSDDFEKRGFDLVRYSLDEEYVENAQYIPNCDIVFIAVPTPTTANGFDVTVVKETLALVGAGKTAVIKSTIIPGTTEALQAEFPNIFVLHSPEFLVERTAAHDATHPIRNIVGIPKDTDEYRKKAEEVLSVLPKAPYEAIMSARDAEFVKYAGNCYLFTKVIYMNMLYDLVESMGGNWQQVRDALVNDPRVGESHTEPIHQSGRGAGGHCFMKDFEAFRHVYETQVGDKAGSELMRMLAYKNIRLLTDSKKDLDILERVYGNLHEHPTYKSLHDTLS